MPEPTLDELLAAAAGLLLRPPSPVVLAALERSGGASVDIGTARQDFYDVLCVPASGRYIPPYAHVVVRGRERADGWWQFPAPRHDGGDALASWYRALAFDPLGLDVDPLLRGPQRPLDHLGFVLAFLASAVASRAQTGDVHIADAAMGNFVTEHLDGWVDRYCELLAGSGSTYLQAVADAVGEAVSATRAEFPPAPLAVGRGVTADAKTSTA